jgi:hypothetical protein
MSRKVLTVNHTGDKDVKSLAATESTSATEKPKTFSATPLSNSMTPESIPESGKLHHLMEGVTLSRDPGGSGRGDEHATVRLRIQLLPVPASPAAFFATKMMHSVLPNSVPSEARPAPCECRREEVIRTIEETDVDGVAHEMVEDDNISDGSSLWLSEFSEEGPVLGVGHPFLEVKNELTAQALLEFRAWRERAGGKRRQPSGANIEQSSSNTQPTAPRKRARFEGNDDENDDENGDDDRPSTANSKILGPNDKKLLLACPFYKKDQVKYMNCLKRFELKRIRDVKQHLWRKHRTPQFYCPTCWETFEAESGRDDHLTARNCQTRPKPAYDGISEAQKQDLGRRVDTNATEEMQWYSVWDIVFPGEPRPAMVYLGNELEEVVSMIRDFWTSNGQRFVSQFLGERNLLAWSNLSEERDLQAIHRDIQDDMINSMINSMLTEFEDVSSAAFDRDLRATTPTTPSTPSYAAGRSLLTPAPSYSRGSTSDRGGASVRSLQPIREASFETPTAVRPRPGVPSIAIDPAMGHTVLPTVGSSGRPAPAGGPTADPLGSLDASDPDAVLASTDFNDFSLNGEMFETDPYMGYPPGN